MAVKSWDWVPRNQQTLTNWMHLLNEKRPQGEIENLD